MWFLDYLWKWLLSPSVASRLSQTMLVIIVPQASPSMCCYWKGHPRPAWCSLLFGRMRCVVTLCDGVVHSFSLKYFSNGRSRDVLQSESCVELFGAKICIKVASCDDRVGCGRSVMEHRYLTKAALAGFSNCPCSYGYFENVYILDCVCSVLLVSCKGLSIDLMFLQIEGSHIDSLTCLYLKRVFQHAMELLVRRLHAENQVIECPSASSVGVTVDWVGMRQDDAWETKLEVVQFGLSYDKGASPCFKCAMSGGRREKCCYVAEQNRMLKVFVADFAAHLLAVRTLNVNGGLVYCEVMQRLGGRLMSACTKGIVSVEMLLEEFDVAQAELRAKDCAGVYWL